MRPFRTWLEMLRALFRRPDQQACRIEIILYTRMGCHLCEDALALLVETQSHTPFEFQVRDVDQDQTLLEKFGTCVPVVTINGKLRFRGRVNKVLLLRLLRAST